MPSPLFDFSSRFVSGKLSRRQLIKGVAATLVSTVIPVPGSAQIIGGTQEPLTSKRQVSYGKDVLPPGIRSRFVQNISGLTMRVLEAGYETRNGPCVLLLHGFPELAYSWRKVMRPLAEAGYHVVAPDQRGYGRTTGWDPDYDGDLASFRRLNLVRDALGLISALGYRSVDAVVGHDFGSPIAAWCALVRPDVFRSVVLMSAPFSGTHHKSAIHVYLWCQRLGVLSKPWCTGAHAEQRVHRHADCSHGR